MDEFIAKHYPDWNTVFSDYQQLRKPNADAIADLAIQNYSEMADKVGDKEFLHKKHVEHDLAELYPEEFKSQYELVTFSTTPYKYALDRGKVNERILNAIVKQKLESELHNREKILPILEEADRHFDGK